MFTFITRITLIQKQGENGAYRSVYYFTDIKKREYTAQSDSNTFKYPTRCILSDCRRITSFHFQNRTYILQWAGILDCY